VKHLYFCRHGQSELNKAGMRAGQTETPLTEEGRLQAKQAGEAAEFLHVDYIISSPYSRALDTAHIIADVIGYPSDKIELNALFIERHFGVLEGQPYSPDHDLDNTEGAEHSNLLYERVKKAYEYLQSLEADNILVVGHSSTGRMLRHVINPSVPFGPPSFPNAEIVQLI
jgi:broad specificity phosphatase PhoE